MYVPWTWLKGIQSPDCTFMHNAFYCWLIEGVMVESTSLPPLLLSSTSLTKVDLPFTDLASLHCPSCDDLLHTRQEDDWAHGCLEVPPGMKLFSVIVIDSLHKVNSNPWLSAKWREVFEASQCALLIATTWLHHVLTCVPQVDFK